MQEIVNLDLYEVIVDRISKTSLLQHYCINANYFVNCNRLLENTGSVIHVDLSFVNLGCMESCMGKVLNLLQKFEVFVTRAWLECENYEALLAFHTKRTTEHCLSLIKVLRRVYFTWRQERLLVATHSMF